MCALRSAPHPTVQNNNSSLPPEPPTILQICPRQRKASSLTKREPQKLYPRHIRRPRWPTHKSPLPSNLLDSIARRSCPQCTPLRLHPCYFLPRIRLLLSSCCPESRTWRLALEIPRSHKSWSTRRRSDNHSLPLNLPKFYHKSLTRHLLAYGDPLKIAQ